MEPSSDEGGALSFDLDSGSVEALEAVKEEANAFVKAGDFAAALAKYADCLVMAEKEGKAYAADYDAERRAEKVVLACHSNRALCALKLFKFDLAKQCCAQGLEANAKLVRRDEAGKAKLLFRRGQALLGLKDGRSAADAIAEAVDIEERLLGVSNKEAAMRLDESERRKKISTIQSMKRELLKAKRQAKQEEQLTQKENFGKAKGFLSANSKKTITDNKTQRKEFLDYATDRILSLVFEKDNNDGEGTENNGEEQKKFAAFQGLLANLDKRQIVGKAKDFESRVRSAAVAAYLYFLLAEFDDKENVTPKRAYYDKAARHWALAFDERKKFAKAPSSDQGGGGLSLKVETAEDELLLLEKTFDDLDEKFFAPLGKICALESAGHACVRAGRPAEARPFLIAFAEAARKAGELPAYHNLPDSYLLQRGMPKMDDKARRAFKWKHRAHSTRAVFDAYSAVASASKDLGDRTVALEAAFQALEVADEFDAKAVAHNNLAYLHGFRWKTYENSPEDERATVLHSTLARAFEKEQDKKNQEDNAKKQTNDLRNPPRQVEEEYDDQDEKKEDDDDQEEEDQSESKWEDIPSDDATGGGGAAAAAAAEETNANAAEGTTTATMDTDD